MCMGCDERDEHDDYRLQQRVEDTSVYMIRSTTERAEDGSFLWWSERLRVPASSSPTETAHVITRGWGSLNGATAYADDLHPLPEGGAWVDFSSEVETINDPMPSPRPEFAGLVNRTHVTLGWSDGEQIANWRKTVVEQATVSLTLEVRDHRGKMTEPLGKPGDSYYSPPKKITSVYVSGTDVEGVHARFAELTA